MLELSFLFEKLHNSWFINVVFNHITDYTDLYKWKFLHIYCLLHIFSKHQPGYRNKNVIHDKELKSIIYVKCSRPVQILILNTWEEFIYLHKSKFMMKYNSSISFCYSSCISSETLIYLHFINLFQIGRIYFIDIID